MTTYTCEQCGAPALHGVSCNPCYTQRLRSLLSSPSWLAARGCATGDLPGETLADTLKRQLHALEANHEHL